MTMVLYPDFNKFKYKPTNLSLPNRTAMDIVILLFQTISMANLCMNRMLRESIKLLP